MYRSRKKEALSERGARNQPSSDSCDWTRTVVYNVEPSLHRFFSSGDAKISWTLFNPIKKLRNTNTKWNLQNEKRRSNAWTETDKKECFQNLHKAIQLRSSITNTVTAQTVTWPKTWPEEDRRKYGSFFVRNIWIVMNEARSCAPTTSCTARCLLKNMNFCTHPSVQKSITIYIIIQISTYANTANMMNVDQI